MPWDDELTDLARRVRDTFGKDTLDEAMARAVAAFTANAQFSPAVRSGQPSGGLVSSDGRALSLGDFYEALRAELRQLTTMH